MLAPGPLRVNRGCEISRHNCASIRSVSRSRRPRSQSCASGWRARAFRTSRRSSRGPRIRASTSCAAWCRAGRTTSTGVCTKRASMRCASSLNRCTASSCTSSTSPDVVRNRHRSSSRTAGRARSLNFCTSFRCLRSASPSSRRRCPGTRSPSSPGSRASASRKSPIVLPT